MGKMTMYENVTFPSLPDRDQLVILKNKAVDGDKEASDTIILCHMPFAIKIANEYARTTHDYEEMLSVATSRLVASVNRLKNLKHLDITSYLLSSVKFACFEARRQNKAIKVPSRKTVVMEPLTDIKDNKIFDSMEFEDTLDSIIRLPVEREIIDLRRSGLTDKAIAKRLDVARSYVTRIRTKLARRFVNESK